MQTRVTQGLSQFFKIEAASGILLLLCALTALALSNSPVSKYYFEILKFPAFGMSIAHWINDGLMTIFFLVVGLEIKREIVHGELSSRKQAALPVAAAIGGMLVPAGIYLLFNWGSREASGWGIPMATDIAFAIGVLTLLGKRVPVSLKIFLTALAIVDDLGAVLVIALFYTAKLSWINLGIGVAILGALFALNRMGVRRSAFFLLAGIPVWIAFFNSGIHATIAGVLLAFVIPLKTGNRIEHAIHPWVSFGIMPIFALANAGVSLTGGSLFHPVSLGVIAGLVIGKQIGITLFSWLSVKLGLAVLPKNSSWRHIYGVGWLGGIGFTMSLFIANLAFQGAQANDTAKIGILMASVLAGSVGSFILLRTPTSLEKSSSN